MDTIAISRQTAISIHVLREEDDCAATRWGKNTVPFLSTSSARRTT